MSCGRDYATSPVNGAGSAIAGWAFSLSAKASMRTTRRSTGFTGKRDWRFVEGAVANELLEHGDRSCFPQERTISGASTSFRMPCLMAGASEHCVWSMTSRASRWRLSSTPRYQVSGSHANSTA